jgi:hypothetical protein
MKTYLVEASVLVHKKVAHRVEARDPRSAMRKVDVLIRCNDPKIETYDSYYEVDDIRVVSVDEVETDYGAN